MQYDPIKRSLGSVFNRHPQLRILFYKLLDLLLLRAWYIHRDLKRFLKTNTGPLSILDAGSGFGQYSWYISGKAKESSILGVDVKTEQIEDCNGFFTTMGRSSRVRFEEADLTRFVRANEYHLILTVDVMEHILEDVLVFKNFYASMRKGGMLLISTPSDQGGSDAHDEHDDSFIDEHVRNGYNILEIEDKLRSAGFTRVEPRYSYGKPGSMAWRLSMKYPIVMLNTSRIFFVLLPFYYLLAWPLSLVLNCLDINSTHSRGTGLIVKAWKE
jgi:SAM-dependent methyltransferase